MYDLIKISDDEDLKDSFIKELRESKLIKDVSISGKVPSHYFDLGFGTKIRLTLNVRKLIDELIALENIKVTFSNLSGAKCDGFEKMLIEKAAELKTEPVKSETSIEPIKYLYLSSELTREFIDWIFKHFKPNEVNELISQTDTTVVLDTCNEAAATVIKNRLKPSAVVWEGAPGRTPRECLSRLKAMNKISSKSTGGNLLAKTLNAVWFDPERAKNEFEIDVEDEPISNLRDFLKI